MIAAGVIALLIDGRHGADDRLAALEVVAANGHAALHDVAGRRPVADAVFFARAAVALEGHFLGAVDRLGGGGIVGDDELVAAGVVLEPVDKAGGIPAPLQVVAVGFIKLAGILHDLLAAGDAPVPVAQAAVVGEHAGSLVVQGGVMEQVIILAQAQVAEPRAERGLVIGDAAIDLLQAEAEYMAREVAQAAVLAHHLHGQHLALHVFQRNVGRVGEQFERVFEGPRQTLDRVELVDQEQVCRCIVIGKIQAQESLVLAVGEHVLQAGNHITHGLALYVHCSECQCPVEQPQQADACISFFDNNRIVALFTKWQRSVGEICGGFAACVGTT